MDFLGIINFDFLRQNITKKSLKIPKEKPEAVIQRKTHTLEKPMKQSRMGNPEKLATLGIQDPIQRQTKQRNTTQYVLDTTKVFVLPVFSNKCK
jgi:hypothetical protein